MSLNVSLAAFIEAWDRDDDLDQDTDEYRAVEADLVNDVAGRSASDLAGELSSIYPHFAPEHATYVADGLAQLATAYANDPASDETYTAAAIVRQTMRG